MEYKHFAVSGPITHERLKGLEGRFKRNVSEAKRNCRAFVITPTRLFENQETEIKYKGRKIIPLFHGKYIRPCISLNHFLVGRYPIEDLTQLMLIYETINSPQILLEEKKGISAAYLSKMNSATPIASLSVNNCVKWAFLEALGDEYEEADEKVYVPKLRILKKRKEKTLLKRMLKICGNLLEADIERLIGDSHEKSISEKRAWTMFAMRKLTDFTTQEIGKVLNKNHSTVLYNINKIERETPERKRRLFLEEVKEKLSI